MPKPSSKLLWTYTNPNQGTVSVEPTSGKKTTGWTPAEKPPAETMNWLFLNLSEWIDYLEDFTDTQKQDLDTLLASLTAQLIVNEVPSGVVDGSNKVFTLTASPLSAQSVVVKVGATELAPSEFSLAGATITIGAGVSAPEVGQVVTVLYQKQIGVSMPIGGGGGGSPAGYTPYGSLASPQIINPSIGVPVLLSQRQIIFVRSTAGTQAVTANPQVQPGSVVGAEALLVGTSDTDYITLADGNGLALNGGIDLKLNKTITLVWTGAVWLENGRR